MDTKSAPIWRTPLAATLSTGILLLALFVYSPYGGVLYLFIIAPLAALILLSLLLGAAVSKKRRSVLVLLLTTAGLVGISWLLITHETVLRPILRWAVHSGHYKAELLAQPNAASGFRHLEWDEWGFVPSGDNVVYLVYDPHDSLAGASARPEPLRIDGIPCEVPTIRRLEAQWYFVQFYTDEQWGNCTQANR